MQEIYNRIQQMNLDYLEYFHLKLLLLSRSSHVLSAETNETHSTRTIVDEQFLPLEMHIRRTYPLQPQRIEQLKLLVNQLRTLSSPEVQNIFFKNILGYCSVELILRNLYETTTRSS